MQATYYYSRCRRTRKTSTAYTVPLYDEAIELAMITPLPVPSKGALRILRQIAYAGSFAGSVGGAAFVLEDRRRRICAARQIHETTKKLKSSRKYHSTAAGSETEEEAHSGYATYRNWELESGINGSSRRPPFLPSEINKAYESVHSEVGSRYYSDKGTAENNNTEWGGSESNAGSDGERLIRTDPVEIKKPLLRYTFSVVKERKVRPRTRNRGRTLAKDGATKENAAVQADQSTLDQHSTSSITTMPPELTSEEAESTYDNNTLKGRIEGRLAQKDTPQAVALFLEACSDGSIAELEAQLPKFGSKLASAALNDKHFKLVESIFSQLKELDSVDLRCWSTLLKALALQGQHVQVIDAFKSFQGMFKASDESYLTATQAFVAQSKLKEAEEVLEVASRKYSSQLRASYVTLLSGMWRATRDLERTKALFERMLSWSENFRPCVPLYNTLIRSCVEDHRDDEAHRYVQEMQEKWGLKPNVRTFGQLLRAKAQRKDWEGVQESLENMLSTGLISQASKPASLLNPLLIEYGKQGNPDEFLEFSRTLIDNFGLQPDQSTSDIIVGALVEAGLVEQINEWLQFAQYKGFKFALTVDSFGRNLDRALAGSRLEDEHLEKLHGIVRQLSRYCVHDQDLHALKKAILHHRSSQNYGKRHQGFKRHGADLGGVRGVHRRMDLEMAQGRPDVALKVYKRAVDEGVVISRIVFETAVEACLRATGSDFTAAYGLIQDAQKSGLKLEDALVPIFVHHLYRSASHVRENVGEDLGSVALGVYRTMEQHGLPIKHHITVATANRLINQRQPSEALNLLTTVTKLPLYESKPFDIVGMTTFLRAYIELHQVTGIQWVLRNVVERNLPVDKPFMEMLKSAKKPLRVILYGHEENRLKNNGQTNIRMMDECRRLLRLLDGWIGELKDYVRQLDKEGHRKRNNVLNFIKSTSFNIPPEK